MTLEQYTYAADGVRMRYYTAGEGRPLLFLHGGGVRAKTYGRNLELLARHYYVIAPDIPPFGGSSMPPAKWDFIDYARYLSKFLNSVGHTSVTVVGHSFGGGIACCLAAHHAQISQLVAIDPAGMFQYPRARFAVQFFVRKAWRNFRQRHISLFLALQRDFMVNIIRNAHHFIPGLQLVERAMSPHYEPIFRRITVPTLLLWGSRDELFPVAAGERLHAMIAGARLEVIEGNHDWCLFDPDKLFSYLT